MLQIIPTASIGDAELMLSDMESLLERGRKGKGNVLGTRVLRDHDVPGVVNAWVYEIEGTGRGHTRVLVGRHIAGTVRHVLFVVETLGYIEPWSWTDVDAVATRQKEKVERTLATSEGGD